MSAWNPVPVDWRAARAALERQAHALAALVEGADLGGRIPGMRWTSDDAVAHVVTQAHSFADFALGHRAPDDDLLAGESALSPATRVALVNDRLLAAQQSRDIVGAVERFLDSTARFDAEHPLRSWEGELDVANATALLLSELALHGFDVAQSLRRPWRIEPSDAALALAVGANLMPRFASAQQVTRLDATFEIVPRPGPTVGVRVGGGALTVAPGRPERADCRIRADAVALLLVAYRRRSLAWAVSRGAVIAYGRRPWLGVRFTGLVDQP